ncbi:KGK domain family protein [Calothrix sp. NIES-4101]|nr:KGK domain family protein [Calothrix sp. NIES-4101]
MKKRFVTVGASKIQLGQTFELKNDDVLVMTGGGERFINQPTTRIKEIMAVILQSHKAFGSWRDDGVECEVLCADGGGGWRKGRATVRFVIDFAPYVTDQEEDETETANQTDKTLNDLRQQLGRNTH